MALDSDAVRALTERLIASPSVSPDVVNETRCARVLSEAMPAGVEHGAWATADGRPVVWALVRGGSARTLIVLGHYDTVGFDEYASLGATEGSKIALDPRALRERLVEAGAGREHGEALERDIEEEWRRAGTWMFGRGALDMKSGLAAGIAALGALAESSSALGGNVLFIATPDEENQSEGMKVALQRLDAMAAERSLEWIGALNLDYVDAPAAYRGAVGKTRVGLWLVGVPAHAGRSFQAVDAAQMAAEIVLRTTLTTALAERHQDTFGALPVALRVRDLKPRYDVQTAAEATVELNVLTFGLTPDEILERVRVVALASVQDVVKRRDALRGEIALERPGSAQPSPIAITLAELEARAPWNVDEVIRVLISPGTPAEDAADAAIRRLRSLAARARLIGPAVVVHELPPHYPAVPPCDGPVSRAAAEILAREGVELRAYYPFITDASLLALNEAPRFGAGAKGRMSESSALASRGVPDIVTLGPWGRDAHSRFERVNAPYAFEKLPRLIAAVARAALR
jgi:arginine utilization protein RocB